MDRSLYRGSVELQKKGLDGSKIDQESIEQTKSKETGLDGLRKLSSFYRDETQNSH